MKKILFLFLTIFSIYANDDYFNFENEYLPEKAEFEKSRKLCFFEFRNSGENAKVSYLSKGIPSILISKLKGFHYVFDDDLLVDSLTYEYGKIEKGKVLKKITNRKSIEELRKIKTLTPEKDLRFLKLELELIDSEIPPFRESILDLGRSKNCFYMISGEFSLLADDSLEINVELTNRKNREVNFYTEKTTLIRAYQEISVLTSSLKRKLFPKEMSSIKVDTSEITDALVFLDGEYLGKTPLEKNEIPAGRHKLSIQKESYANLERTIELKRESLSTYSFELKKITKQAFLTVTSSPEKADVYYGTEYLGKTPLKEIPVRSGQNRIRISKLDHIEYFKGLDLENGEKFKIAVELKKGNTEEYYKTRLKIFGDYTYFDFSTYSIYSVLLFYMTYRYSDYQATVQKDSIRGLVPGFTAIFALIDNPNINSNSKITTLLFYEGIVNRNQQIVERYQNYKVYSIGASVGMLFLSGLFYYLGVDNDAFEFAFTPPTYNQNAESFIQYNYRF